MTLKIGICEDDKEQAAAIRSLAEKTLLRRTEYTMTYFEDGEAVVQAIEQERFLVDLLLLDIRMKRKNGLETAEYIRRHNVDVDIIFITVSKEHVYEGYTYKAFAYILKPAERDRLEQELNRYLDEREQTPNCLQVTINRTVHTICLDKVLYFESKARAITAHMPDEALTFYNKLDTLQALLEEKGFWRCHQSYLVNKSMISRKSRKCVVVQNIELPVSRKYYELSKQA